MANGPKIKLDNSGGAIKLNNSGPLNIQLDSPNISLNQPAKQGGGGGGLWGAVSGAVNRLIVKPVVKNYEALNHEGYVGQQLVKGATTIAQMPVGAYELGRLEVGAAKQGFEHPASGQFAKTQRAIGKAFVQQNVQTVEHPGRNILNTALTVLPFLSGGASVALRGASAASAVGELGDEASLAARAGTVAKTLVKRPDIGERVLKIPGKTLNGEPLPSLIKSEDVQLVKSKGSLARLVQAGHDTVVNRALSKVNEGQQPGVVARYGFSRAAKSVDEQFRIQHNIDSVLPTILERAKAQDGLSGEETSLAHFLRANNVTPEEMATYARAQAEKVGGTTVGRKTFDAQGMPHVSGAGIPITEEDAARLTHLANIADSLAQKGVLHLTSGQVAMGEHVPSPLSGLEPARSGHTVEINGDAFPTVKATDDAIKEASTQREQILKQHGLIDEAGLTERKNLVGQVLGTGREGQSFTTLRTLKPIAPKSAFARSAGKIIPRRQKLSLGEQATGSGLERGIIPGNTAREVGQGLRAAQRFKLTGDIRQATANLGSDIRQSTEDKLVATTHGPLSKLPDTVQELMGKLHDSSITPAEEAALNSGLRDWVSKNYVKDSDIAVGQMAPEGWRFVHEKLVPDSMKVTGSLKGSKFVDSLNSAITSATVYTKLGHLPQRLLTNATANAVQTMNPVTIAKNVILAHKLPDRLKMEMEAATGGHASTAPLSGIDNTGKVIRAGRKLAQGWARYADSPFRLNSLLTELRAVGYDTPEKVAEAMRIIKDPTRSGVDGATIMKIDGAVRRSNRAAIMYDGMSNAEKTRVAKYMWFYPWTKGALRFAGHTVADHPIKAGIGGQLGQFGNAASNRELGPRPTYELGLGKLWGGSKFPVVSDLAALTPYGTAAQIGVLASDPFSADSGLPSLANPSLAGAENVIKGKGFKGFVEGVISPTPEYQVGNAIANPKGSGLFPTTSKNLFGASGLSTAFRALTFGTATPRKVNRAKLTEDAKRQHMKFRDIRIYQK